MTGAGMLHGRAILVTGAGGGGVGRGVADAVVEAGGRVVVHEAEERGARAAAERWPDAVAVWGDLTDPAQVARFVDEAFTTADVSGLVNNAGIGLHRLFHDATVAEFDRLYDVDVRGTWLVSRAVTKRWLDAGTPGAIVHVSSVHATATVAGYALYAGAKGAIDALTRGMAVELGPHRIRVNAIAPGYVASQQNEGLLATLTDRPEAWPDAHVQDQQAVQQPVRREDCGAVAAFLLSESATGVTGHVISVDNGTTALLYNRSFTNAPEAR